MFQIGHCDAWLALYSQLAPGWSYQWALVMSEKVNASTSLMLWMKQEMWPSDQVRTSICSGEMLAWNLMNYHLYHSVFQVNSFITEICNMAVEPVRVSKYCWVNSSSVIYCTK